MVGGLVQKQDVRLAKQQAAKRNAAPFATGECGYVGIRRGALKGVHSPFKLGINLPTAVVLYQFCKLSLALYQFVHLVIVQGLAELGGDIVILCQQVHNLLNAFLNNFQNCLGRVHLWFLLQITYAVTGSPYNFSLIGFFYSGDNFEQGTFTAAVKADDANFSAVEKG